MQNSEVITVQKWMKRAVEDLQLMEQRKLAIGALNIRIRRLEADMVSLTGAGGGKTPVKGGGNRQEAKWCAWLDRKQKLEAEERGLRELVEHTEKCLQSLPDKERAVLSAFYLSNLSRTEAVRKLEQELYVSEATVYRIRERALIQFSYMMGEL